MNRRIRIKLPTREQVLAMDLVCAWQGCRERSPRKPLAPGWVGLATFHTLRTPGVLDFLHDRTFRDAVLCPQHAKALEALLKPIA